MSKGPRDYGVGTERALFALSSGTCYFPGCERPVIELAGGHYITAVEIAHIRGANRGSPRFDPLQTNEERASFPNLMLLCRVHHTLIDKTSPAAYPVETLEAWKTESESDEIRASAKVLTVDDLDDALASTFAALAPSRVVEVSVMGAIAINSVDVMALELGELTALLAANPDLSSQPRLVVADIRNTGTLDVSVSQIDFWLRLQPETGSGEDVEARLMGRNDLGASNPALPHRLHDGDAVQWYMQLNTLEMLAKGFYSASDSRVEVTGVRASVRIASGETFDSPYADWVF